MLKKLLGWLTKPKEAKLYLHLWYVPYVIELEAVDCFEKNYKFNYRVIEQNKYGAWVSTDKFLQRHTAL
jgi:hypothetical protein